MRVPNHIAIILDGNGRWAKKRGMPRSFGHVKGCENLEDICEVAKELGVKYLTVYAFSTENWKRSKEEVDGLMKLFRNYLKKCIKISQKNNMRVKVIGDITAFDSDIQESIKKLEDFSKDFTDLHFQIALNYGSRDEITRAVNRMLEDQKAGKLETPVSEDTISDYLDTAGIPDPDLMIHIGIDRILFQSADQKCWNSCFMQNLCRSAHLLIEHTITQDNSCAVDSLPACIFNHTARIVGYVDFNPDLLQRLAEVFTT